MKDVCCVTNFIYFISPSVNNGSYIDAVCDRNQAENISRVLYPNDNVSHGPTYNTSIQLLNFNTSSREHNCE